MWRGRFDSIFSVFTFAAVLAILCGGIQSFQDAPFKRPESVYRDAMVCPRGISNKTGGIIFLVHGAATTGAKTWGEGPFNERLANYGPEYDVCWVNLPWNGLGDLQQSAEYVAYGIKHFASLSHASGNKINVIAHSQGAGANNSKYMKAQNSESDEYSGANAQVKTISIFSIYDQVVQWEGSKGKASYLKGATMLSLQSEKLCGKGHIVGHLGIAEDLATLKIIQAIIPPSNPISNELDNFDKSSCRHLGGLWLKLISRWTYVLNVGMNFAVGPARMHKLFNEFAHLRVAKEPGLQSYVCERGYATDCLPSNATFADLRE
ncbi:hypothetical protein KEM48_013927 [Puccinia striiformis f. sp. tritici PST-130]|nr:hypothetical protein KEM48_013927 [Puccinia striiformis f. sp. tritici PST-130]